MTPAAAADVEAELTGARVEPALQRPHYRRRDAGGMPVHAHDAAVGLEPERVAQPREEGGPTVVDDDAFGDRRPERRHARGEPCGYAAAVQREIGDAGTLHNLILPRHIHPRDVSGHIDLCTKRLRRTHDVLQDVSGPGTGRGGWQSTCVQDLVARVRIVHVRLAVADGVKDNWPERDRLQRFALDPDGDDDALPCHWLVDIGQRGRHVVDKVAEVVEDRTTAIDFHAMVERRGVPDEYRRPRL